MVTFTEQAIVTASQMQAIEDRLLAAGMPVAALMEKVALKMARRLSERYPIANYPRVGILVGPGHNGGDALVVARELFHEGRSVKIHLPVTQVKPLTLAHWNYVQVLGIPNVEISGLADCDFIVDGFFGIGLQRELTEAIADAVAIVNRWRIPTVSIDLPSGLDTDTGFPLGTAIAAQHTFCLGLWKRGFFQEEALPFLGTVERLDFDIPETFVRDVLPAPTYWRINPDAALAMLPPHRSPTVHKYHVGRLLLVCGSRRYAGAAILAGLGARATGVGMLTFAVPASLRDLVLGRLPEALVLPCPETPSGAIAALPELDWSKYDAGAVGMGLSLDAAPIAAQLLEAPLPLVLDADALNAIAAPSGDPLHSTLMRRAAKEDATILTPHWGEFCRLFPVAGEQRDRLAALEAAVRESGAIVLLKGARTAIGVPYELTPQIWINPESSPALARGGSGDVLAGIIGGLLAQGISPQDATIAATVWHAQTAIAMARQRTVMGVDPVTLAENLLPLPVL